MFQGQRQQRSDDGTVELLPKRQTLHGSREHHSGDELVKAIPERQVFQIYWPYHLSDQYPKVSCSGDDGRTTLVAGRLKLCPNARCFRDDGDHSSDGLCNTMPKVSRFRENGHTIQRWADRSKAPQISCSKDDSHTTPATGWLKLPESKLFQGQRPLHSASISVKHVPKSQTFQGRRPYHTGGVSVKPAPESKPFQGGRPNSPAMGWSNSSPRVSVSRDNGHTTPAIG